MSLIIRSDVRIVRSSFQKQKKVESSSSKKKFLLCYTQKAKEILSFSSNSHVVTQDILC